MTAADAAAIMNVRNMDFLLSGRAAQAAYALVQKCRRHF